MENEFQYQDYAALLAHLESLADEPYRKMQNRIVPGIDSILGVRVPKLRTLAKQIAKGDWRAFLDAACDDATENNFMENNSIQKSSMEEIMLQGLVIGYAKMELGEALDYFTVFVPKIDNWAVCDICCSSFKFTVKNREKVFTFLQPYFKSSREFELRFASVMLMDFYLTDEYIDAALRLLDEIHHDGYYVKMAVAWALSVCFVKYPEKTMRLFKMNRLDDWTYNKALQKILESYRVDDNTKKIIRSMKRKMK